jgi:hypothetical protein
VDASFADLASGGDEPPRGAIAAGPPLAYYVPGTETSSARDRRRD